MPMFWRYAIRLCLIQCTCSLLVFFLTLKPTEPSILGYIGYSYKVYGSSRVKLY